jgi:hypothetical protein
MSFMVEGWFRDKDENTICQEGYRKKQKTLPENQGDMEATVDSAHQDHFSKWRL